METPDVHTNQSLTQIKSVGSILHELVNTSGEPLYKGYRDYLATKKENGGQDDE